ncbi:hypothetical protein [uncultured Nostoc sp.]|nr:hypothetical protein [uncultured Nostoc sp.]
MHLILLNEPPSLREAFANAQRLLGAASGREELEEEIIKCKFVEN